MENYIYAAVIILVFLGAFINAARLYRSIRPFFKDVNIITSFPKKGFNYVYDPATDAVRVVVTDQEKYDQHVREESNRLIPDYLKK